MAAELGVTPRHIRMRRAEFGETGSVHVPRPPDRPALLPPSQEEVRLVWDIYRLEKAGVLRTAISLRRAGHNITRQRACRIMKENGRSYLPRQSREGGSGSDTSGSTPTPCDTPTGTP